MNSQPVRRAMTSLILGLCVAGMGHGPSPTLGALSKPPDPAQLLPLDQIAPEHRESLAEVISSHTLYRQGAPESFPCNPNLYLNLLNEPALTLSLWQDLSTSPARLKQVGPDRYQGTDGAGTSATWEFVYRSPKLHVLLCQLDYVSPRTSTHLVGGRIVMIVRSDYYRKGKDEHWVRHQVEAFVKVDSKGWRALAKTIRPLIEKLLEDQVQEAGWFVSLMGRLVEIYPDWACEVAARGPEIRPETRQTFDTLVRQNRRPGAFPGRPVLAENPPEATRLR